MSDEGHGGNLLESPGILADSARKRADNNTVDVYVNLTPAFPSGIRLPLRQPFDASGSDR